MCVCVRDRERESERARERLMVERKLVKERPHRRLLFFFAPFHLLLPKDEESCSSATNFGHDFFFFANFRSPASIEDRNGNGKKRKESSSLVSEVVQSLPSPKMLRPRYTGMPRMAFRKVRNESFYILKLNENL